MKKIMISLAAAALACAAFTGCQKKGAGEGDAARSAGGKIELEMYYYKQENQTYEDCKGIPERKS